MPDTKSTELTNEQIDKELAEIDKELEKYGKLPDKNNFRTAGLNGEQYNAELENINNILIESSKKKVVTIPKSTLEPEPMNKPFTVVDQTPETEEPFSARKIAICGFAQTSYMLAPWGNSEWEIWGLNALHKQIKWTNNITRWFQIHPKESVFGEGKGGGKDHVEFLKQLKIPVYMTQHYDEIPMSVAYPLKEICEWFSIGREKERQPYLSNTISEILALLIYEIVLQGREVDEVGVWGVDMAHATEYSYQRSSCEFYLGIIEGLRQVKEIFKRCGFVMGIEENGIFKKFQLPYPDKWILPKESTLLQTPYIYGYEELEESADYNRMVARKNQLIQSRNLNLQKEQEAHDAQMQFLGAIQENENEIKNRGY